MVRKKEEKRWRHNGTTSIQRAFLSGMVSNKMVFGVTCLRLPKGKHTIKARKTNALSPKEWR
jgi:hypothetical protein